MATSYSSLSSASSPSNSPLGRRPLPLSFQTSPSPSVASSPRYVSFSAASQAGSVNSSTPTTSRFKRGHARARTATPAKQMNPDDYDLMLDDPDEVFRLFPVRDVQGLEKRARFVLPIAGVYQLMLSFSGKLLRAKSLN